MEKVAVNAFVTRQVKGSGKTYSSSLTFEEIAKDAENQMKKEETLHHKMYEIATSRYNPFSVGGSENCDSDLSCNIGGSENASQK